MDLPYRVLPKEKPGRRRRARLHSRRTPRAITGLHRIAVTDGVLEVGIVDPDNIEAQGCAPVFISTKVSLPYKLFLISDTDFDRVLDQYQNLTGRSGRGIDRI